MESFLLRLGFSAGLRVLLGSVRFLVSGLVRRRESAALFIERELSWLLGSSLSVVVHRERSASCESRACFALYFFVRLALLSSWSSLVFVLRLVPGFVRLLGPILEVVLRGSDASTGRIGASSHQHVFGSARGFAGAREGSRLTAFGSSSLSLRPGSEQLEDHTRWRGSR